MFDTSIYRTRMGSSGNLAPVLQLRCRVCSHWRSPAEFVAGGPITGYCLRCLEWHNKALDMLAGGPPAGCQECGLTFAELSDLTVGADVRMYLHPKDGIYQLLCKPCSDAYELKRRDLFRHTPYGQSKKI